MFDMSHLARTYRMGLEVSRPRAENLREGDAQRPCLRPFVLFLSCLVPPFAFSCPDLPPIPNTHVGTMLCVGGSGES